MSDEGGARYKRAECNRAGLSPALHEREDGYLQVAATTVEKEQRRPDTSINADVATWKKDHAAVDLAVLGKPGRSMLRPYEGVVREVESSVMLLLRPIGRRERTCERRSLYRPIRWAQCRSEKIPWSSWRGPASWM